MVCDDFQLLLEKKKMYFGFDDTSFVQPLLLYISSACALSNVSLSLSLSLFSSLNFSHSIE